MIFLNQKGSALPAVLMASLITGSVVAMNYSKLEARFRLAQLQAQKQAAMDLGNAWTIEQAYCGAVTFGFRFKDRHVGTPQPITLKRPDDGKPYYPPGTKIGGGMAIHEVRFNPATLKRDSRIQVSGNATIAFHLKKEGATAPAAGDPVLSWPYTYTAADRLTGEYSLKTCTPKATSSSSSSGSSSGGGKFNAQGYCETSLGGKWVDKNASSSGGGKICALARYCKKLDPAIKTNASLPDEQCDGDTQRAVAFQKGMNEKFFGGAYRGWELRARGFDKDGKAQALASCNINTCQVNSMQIILGLQSHDVDNVWTRSSCYSCPKCYDKANPARSFCPYR